ncbi:hypothetical protein FKM82_011339 [Ascaphus truei]
MHIFVGESKCTNISGNSSALQCFVSQLTAGRYQVKCLDLRICWASSNATFTSLLIVTSIRSSIGCLDKGRLYIHGIGIFSRKYISYHLWGSL